MLYDIRTSSNLSIKRHLKLKPLNHPLKVHGTVPTGLTHHACKAGQSKLGLIEF